ncbi:hypothetical protein NG796_09580 [Laspinema sp. A4]|uniref:hypothetical protein n=1 Tax=Laspinema sp. D2d TaxID=2953686 RepID=UPI0021BB4021|nr:hypothetical protein [Laspinema sp. D2d]MCT7983547.1 hypothetical protein [Laspinema sp. D2d]
MKLYPRSHRKSDRGYSVELWRVAVDTEPRSLFNQLESAILPDHNPGRRLGRLQGKRQESGCHPLDIPESNGGDPRSSCDLE